MRNQKRIPYQHKPTYDLAKEYRKQLIKENIKLCPMCKKPLTYNPIVGRTCLTCRRKRLH